jgi:regulator of replication initiation timing
VVGEKQLLLRRLKKEEQTLKDLEASIGPLNQQLDLARMEKQRIEVEKKAVQKSLEHVAVENRAAKSEVVKGEVLTRDAQSEGEA